MTITLTGATGFVGRQILRALVARGHRVRALVRNRARLGEDTANLEIRHSNDLFAEPTERLRELVAGSHTLIHAAWYTEPGRYMESPLNIDCLRGTIRLARAFAEEGGARFVGLGTCMEYDLSDGLVSTQTPLCPRTTYASSKAAAFRVLERYLSEADVSFAWCRLFYLFGEGEDDRRLVPTIRRALREGREVRLTHGHQIRDYMDVVLAAKEIVDVAFMDGSGAVNICSGHPITIRTLAKRIADEFSGRHLLNFGAVAPPEFDLPKVVGVKTSFLIPSDVSQRP
jgi:nucleoside-diphosphate-sugar epimerase